MFEKILTDSTAKTRFSATYTSFVKTSFQKEVHELRQHEMKIALENLKNYLKDYLPCVA